MRVVVVLCLLAACGRFGFESLDDVGPDGAVDSSFDAPMIPASAFAISGFDLGGVGTRVRDISAEALDDGYALGFVMEPSSSLYGVHLTPGLVPNAAVPFQTSPIAGFSGTYDGVSLAWDGTNLVGALSDANGTVQLKTFPRDMMLFASATQRTGKIGEPSVARAGTQMLSTWFDATELFFTLLTSDGTSDGTDLGGGAHVANILTTTAASGDIVFLAAALGNGSCEVHSVTTLGVASIAIAGPCSSPHAVGSGSTFMLAYASSSSTISVRSFTGVVNTPPMETAELLSRSGRMPRLFEIGGERVVAFIDAASLEVVRIADSAELDISGLPTGPPDAFDVAGPYVFATYGATVYAVTPN